MYCEASPFTPFLTFPCARFFPFAELCFFAVDFPIVTSEEEERSLSQSLSHAVLQRHSHSHSLTHATGLTAHSVRIDG
jgi:hypothetical protein